MAANKPAAAEAPLRGRHRWLLLALALLGGSLILRRSPKGTSTDGKASGDGGVEQNDPPPPTFPPALAAALTLLAAGLAAVGVTGDALARAVRNNPWGIAAAVSVVLLAAGLLVLPARRPRFVGPLLMVLVLAVIGAAWLGARAVADREQPLITLQSAADNKGRITLTVDVNAAGIRTTDQVLVQVIGLKKFTETNEATVSLCERNHTWNSGRPEDYQKVDTSDGVLLLWSRIGPDRTGAVKSTLKVEVPSGAYEGVCAWAPLPEKSGESAAPRNAAAYLKLTPDPPTTPTPTGKPTGRP